MTNPHCNLQIGKQTHIDIFVKNFFLNGARNYIRKTTYKAPWICMGIMERTNTELLHTNPLFADANLVGGGAYSLGHGLIHGYLLADAQASLERAVKNLNSLPTEEIIFYHDESLCGLEQAQALGMSLCFQPVSLLDWLNSKLAANTDKLHLLQDKAAVQLPCSCNTGPDRNPKIDRLLTLCGLTRVERKYDRDKRLCCGARGYFGLFSGDSAADADVSDNLIAQNILDAKQAGAAYLVTLCPYCYAALAPTALEHGLTPLQAEGLASLVLYGEKPPMGLLFL